MAEPKTKKTTASVTAFVGAIENEQRRTDAKQLLKIFKEVTGVKPAMWGPSIIGYGVYHYKSERSTQEGDWPRAGFSPRKANLTIYILPGFAKYEPLFKKLGKHKTSKACLYINKLSDIDIPTLRTIIKETQNEMNRRYPTK
ncbi:DUF1801 domain-containing protein [Acetobacteraceae bacterium]|nr:DUF1801 domain-containing protein [Candidatus Parcubacteria bacterium]